MTTQVKVPEGLKVPIYMGFMEYLANLVPPEQILAYKISDDLSEHLEELFDKNNEGDITPDERKVLDEFVEFDQYVMLLKARAAAALKSSQ